MSSCLRLRVTAHATGSPIVKPQTVGGNAYERSRLSSKVVFWKIDEYRRKTHHTGQLEDHKSICSRYYTVFNLEQCEGSNP